MDYQNFILPIFVHIMDNNNSNRPSLVGNGFFVNDLFITASHVISDNQGRNDQSNPYVIIDGKEIELISSKAFIWKTMPYDYNGDPIGHANIENGDFVAYEILNINSPLKLANSLPNYGEKLQCCYYHNIKLNSIDNKQVFISDINPIYYWDTEGVVFDSSGFLGNFYGAKMSPQHPTSGGSSGSPLLKDNIVYGILHAGNPHDELEDKTHPEICIFYAASAALQLFCETYRNGIQI